MLIVKLKLSSFNCMTIIALDIIRNQINKTHIKVICESEGFYMFYSMY